MLAIGLDPVGGFFLRTAANLADHDDTFSLWICGEFLQAVNEVGAVEGVTANAHTSALPHSRYGGLVDCLVGQSTGPADNADLACLVDVSWHDAHLALARLDDARTVGTNQARLVLTHQGVFHLHHVLLRNTLRDAHDQWDFRL